MARGRLVPAPPPAALRRVAAARFVPPAPAVFRLIAGGRSPRRATFARLGFDPAQPLRSFEAPPRRRARRRGTRLRFVEQGGVRFVVKSFAEPGDGPEDAVRRLRRELDAIAAFREAGADALEPLAGPFDELRLTIDGEAETFPHALVYPLVEAPTLYDALAAAPRDVALAAEAGRRIRARHDAATSLAAIHTDGSAHNVFSDWRWFDFCEPHSGDQARDCKALELLRFVSSVVEVSRAGMARRRIAAFAAAYGDPQLVELTLDFARTDETHMRAKMWLRMLGRPDKIVAFLRGDTRHFRRMRTWDALDRAVHG